MSRRMVRKYVQAHLEYAASVIAPFLPDMSVQDIINTVEKDGEIPKKRIVIAKNLSEEKAELLRQAIQNATSKGSGLRLLPSAFIPCRNAWCTFWATSPRRRTAVRGRGPFRP